MGTLTEKLEKTLNSKKRIKAAIEKKGVMVGSAPFNTYSEKIDQIGAESAVMLPDWINIFDVLANDLEDYKYKTIYLLTNEEDTIGLGGGIAYKTSDSNEAFTIDDAMVIDGDYTFTGVGDTPCSEGYKTRYLIVYNDVANNTSVNELKNLEDICLGGVFDGRINASYLCKMFRKMTFAYLTKTFSQIGYSAFQGCTSLQQLTIEDNTNMGCGGLAFDYCVSLKSLDLSNGGVFNISSNARGQYLSLKDFAISNIGSSSNSRYCPIYNSYAENFTIKIYNTSFDRTIRAEQLAFKKIKLIQVEESIIDPFAISSSPICESVEFSPNYTSCIPRYLFHGNLLREAVIPHGVKAVSLYNFHSCQYLRRVYLPNTMISNISSGSSSSFYNCPNLEIIELESGYNAALDISFITSITHDSLVGMCAALKDLTGETAKIFKIGATNLAKLTDEEKAIATNKNWTLS